MGRSSPFAGEEVKGIVAIPPCAHSERERKEGAEIDFRVAPNQEVVPSNLSPASLVKIREKAMRLPLDMFGGSKSSPRRSLPSEVGE